MNSVRAWRSAAIRHIRRAVPPLLTAASVFVVWELSVRLLHVREALLPAPTRIAMLFASAEASLIFQHTLPTLWQAVSGFGTAIVLAVLTAGAITYSRVLNEAIYPYLIGLQVVPKMALAPIFVLWLGIGFASRFVFATFVCFFPIVIALTTGLRGTRPEAVLLARSVGASRIQILCHIRFPFALPYFFTGTKIAATMSLIGVVIGEFITSDKGLGFLILYAGSRSNTPLMMAAIVVLCLAGLAIYSAVVLAEHLTRSRLS